MAGGPEQKWTADEEEALNAGIIKHGAGEWQTILEDPEFKEVLIRRSNVDLKDKWRDLSVIVHGLGSRGKGGIALKRSRSSLNDNDNPLALDVVDEEDFDNEIVDVKAVAIRSGALQLTGPKKPFTRIDDLILEAIKNLNKPAGSNATSITAYIEDNYSVPSDCKCLKPATLAELVASGRLMKVKRKYRMAPKQFGDDVNGRSSSNVLEAHNGSSGESSSSRLENRADVVTPSEGLRQVQANLARMRSMNREEAAAACAQAVAVADNLSAVAEEAVREYERTKACAEELDTLVEVLNEAVDGKIEGTLEDLWAAFEANCKVNKNSEEQRYIRG